LNKNNGFLSSGKKKKEEVVQNLVQKVLHAELGLCLVIAARQTRASAADSLAP
jgi:hypothetical protein